MKRKTNSLICVLLLLFTTGNAQTILTIDQAIELAMMQSPTMRKVQLSLDRSQELLAAQRAALKSNFALDLTPVSYSKESKFDDKTSTWYNTENMSSAGNFKISQPILPTDGSITINNRSRYTTNTNVTTGNIDKTISNNISINLTQPIFTYNRLKMTLKKLELDVETSFLNYGISKLNLERSISQLFYQVYQNQKSLEISKEELKNTQANYTIIKSKVEGGLQALVELYQAELNLASSKSSVQNKEVTLQNSLDNLTVELGLPFDTEIIIMADIVANIAEVNLNEATEFALTNRAELRLREIDLTDANFSMIQTKAINEFRGDIVASYGYDYRQDVDSKEYNKSNTPSIGVNFTVPLYDWGEKRARLKAEQASISMVEMDMDNERTSIILNVRSTIRSINNLANQIDIQRQTLKNAESTYEINLEKYKNGDLTGMDLNLYQTQLSSAKMELTAAIINYKLEFLNLKIQTLYDFRTRESVVPEEFKMTSFKK